jgi:hypothetical protein
MRRVLARWLAVCLLSCGIALGCAPHPPIGITPPHTQNDPGDGGGGGG